MSSGCHKREVLENTIFSTIFSSQSTQDWKGLKILGCSVDVLSGSKTFGYIIETFFSNGMSTVLKQWYSSKKRVKWNFQWDDAALILFILCSSSPSYSKYKSF